MARASIPNSNIAGYASTALPNSSALAVVLEDTTGAALPAGSTADPVFDVPTPTAAVGGAPLNNQTATAAGSLVLKAAAGNVYGVHICTGAQAGYLMLFDAVAAPADGTVTPERVYVVAANSSFSLQLSYPIRCAAGITLVFSSTGPFTKTISATAFLAGDYV